MKFRRLSPTEPKGYCHAGCHNRAALEIVLSAKRPTLRLCERDALHLAEKLKAFLNNATITTRRR
jgi:hypothetical protein